MTNFSVESTPAQASMPRDIFPGLDIVRFLTAVMVMIYHLFFWQNGRLPDTLESFDWFWRFGWVGVQIFFVLSGFVIAASARYATPSQFLIGRIVRLAPTVWICATLTLLASLILVHAGTHRLLVNYARTLILVPVGDHIDIVYWTLTVEVAFYALVLAILLIKDFQTVLKALVVIGIVSTGFDVILTFNVELAPFIPGLCHTVVTASHYHTTRLLLLQHGCFFALGALLWTPTSRPRASSMSLAVLTALFAIGGTVEVWGDAGQQQVALAHSLSTLSPVMAWLIGLAAIVVSSRYHDTWKSQTVRVFRLLGLLTFPVYLLHNNFGLAIRDALLSWSDHKTGVTLLTVALVLTTATIVTICLEPPVARSLKRLLQSIRGRRVQQKQWVVRS